MNIVTTPPAPLTDTGTVTEPVDTTPVLVDHVEVEPVLVLPDDAETVDTIARDALIIEIRIFIKRKLRYRRNIGSIFISIKKSNYF